MEVRRSEFSIFQIVENLCEMVRHLAEAKNIQLTHSIPSEWPLISQDKVKVRQVLTNLISNAIKFTPEGGRISIRGTQLEADDIDQLASESGTLSASPSMLQIEVEDTGVGIAPSDQSIVFQKFRQGASALGDDSLTREVSGTGLGLSIVKELCVLLGGWVELKSEVGQGSIFTVVLPWEYQQINPSPSAINDPRTNGRRSRFKRIVAFRSAKVAFAWMTSGATFLQHHNQPKRRPLNRYSWNHCMDYQSKRRFHNQSLTLCESPPRVTLLSRRG